MLEVGDGNTIYWEVSGNPAGKPAIALHGGPGAGSNPEWRRWFDPERYRLVQFDQRGCGKSTPSVRDVDVDLSSNTTWHLVNDIEQLRRHLEVERWLVFGGSWGSTLGLAYAEALPERVSELVIFSVAFTAESDVEWLTRAMGRLFPEAWARFIDLVPPSERNGNLAAAYARLLADPDPQLRELAAQRWCAWEAAHVAVHATDRADSRYDEPGFRAVFARLVTHYFRHAAWLEPGALLAWASRLQGIPGVLVHGRLDVSSPLDNAWLLAQAWPDAELVIVDDAGHGGAFAGISRALLAATRRFAQKP
jgi:proline iminopeptidase